MDRGLPASIGGWTIAVIGLFNIVGSIASGYIANLMPKRFLLSAIYSSRSLAILIFIMVFASRKRASVAKGHFIGIAVLTLANAAVAVFWR